MLNGILRASYSYLDPSNLSIMIECNLSCIDVCLFSSMHIYLCWIKTKTIWYKRKVTKTYRTTVNRYEGTVLLGTTRELLWIESCMFRKELLCVGRYFSRREAAWRSWSRRRWKWRRRFCSIYIHLNLNIAVLWQVLFILLLVTCLCARRSLWAMATIF